LAERHSVLKLVTIWAAAMRALAQRPADSRDTSMRNTTPVPVLMTVMAPTLPLIIPFATMSAERRSVLKPATTWAADTLALVQRPVGSRAMSTRTTTLVLTRERWAALALVWTPVLAWALAPAWVQAQALA
jgi:hypothetical protein